MASIHTGRWTDWDKGPVLGQKVTIPTASGNILIAFIAIFITFVGIMAWTMVAYAVHQLLISRQPGPRDGMHYQILALLRNGLSALAFAWEVMKVGFAWRKHPIKGVFLRTFSLAALAGLVYAGFVAAGLLLSMLATTGDVLVSPGRTSCGHYNNTLLAAQSYATLYEVTAAESTLNNKEVRQAQAYAEVCYPALAVDGEVDQEYTKAPTSNCHFYVKPALNWTTSYSAPCPFNDGVCKGSNTIQFDTGYLDSTSDLGINTRSEDRLQFRRVTTCSPIVTDGFSTNKFSNQSGFGNVTTYNYGPNLFQPPLSAEWTDNSLNSTNFTYAYSYASYITTDQPYQLTVVSSDLPVTDGDDLIASFTPEPRLAPYGTSVTLLFLANRAYYQEPVDDPWFYTTDQLSASDPRSGGVPWYYNRDPISVLGCVNEVQLCNPNLESNKCMQWTRGFAISTLNGVGNALDPLRLNENQLTLANNIIFNALDTSEMWTLLTTLSISALRATDYLFGVGLSATVLQSNQWIVELQRLQAASLAMLQRVAFSTVAQVLDPILEEFLAPAPQNERAVCYVKIKSDAYFSFSILGLGLIFGIGGFVIVLGMMTIIVTTTATGKEASSRRQWYTNSVLYLQRMVLEDRGLGVWEGSLGSIPTTVDGEKFVAFSDSLGPPTRRFNDPVKYQTVTQFDSVPPSFSD